MGKAKYNWQEIDPVLIAVYNVPGGPTEGSVLALGESLGINQSTLRTRAWRLRGEGVITEVVKGHKAWNSGEERILASKLPRSVRNIPGRTAYAQASHLSRQGIQKRESGYSLVDISIALGVSTTTVYGFTQKSHDRQALLVGTSNGKIGVSRRWYISDSQLHYFFCSNLELIRSYPCPGKLWIDDILNDPILCRQHGHESPLKSTIRKVHKQTETVVEYSGPICRRVRR